MSLRYNRQASINGWDQKALAEASVVVVGAGALGNWVALGLSGLGVGTIKIFDFDELELHNLNRQCCFTEKDVGKNKAEALAERIQERNSEIEVYGYNEKIDSDNIEMLVGNPNMVIDCVDVIHVRRLLSKYCIENDIPLLHGGISWNGWEAGVLTQKTACSNCIYPEALQKAEKEAATSCTRKPESSVVYASEMCGAFMVELVRKILMPLDGDKPYEGHLYKYDSTLEVPMYIQPLHRKDGCEDCLPILKRVNKKQYDFAIKAIAEKKATYADGLKDFLK